MGEIYRLKCESDRGSFTLILTETHMTMEPSAEFRQRIEAELADAKASAQEAGRVAGWITDKAVSFAGKAMAQAFEPHPLEEVDILFHQSEVDISIKRVTWKLTRAKVDPGEALVFSTHYQRLKWPSKH